MKLLPMSAKCNSGISYVFVASVFKVNQTGALIESSKSEPITVAVPDTYALPLYDDFDSGTTETNYWTKEIQLGNSSDGNWNPLIYCGLVDQGLYSAVTSQLPHSSTITSRPLDATLETNVSVSFAIRNQLIGSNAQPLDKDSLSIDITVDKGDNWSKVKTYSLAQLPTNFNFLE